MIKKVFLYCLSLFLPLVTYPDSASSQKLENLDVNKDSEQAFDITLSKIHLNGLD